MIPYSPLLSPPAPMLNIICRNPYDATKQTEHIAQLDTGCDITALPSELISKLELEPKRAIGIAGLANQAAEVSLYEVQIEIVGVRMDYVEVIEWAGNEILLGRDVLNEFYIILDGQMRQFEMRAM